MSKSDKKRDPKNKTLRKLLRRHAINKQLNFLIGSGASQPAIPLMKDVAYDNSLLLEKIKEQSKKLLYENYTESIEQLKSNDPIATVLQNYTDFIKAVCDVLTKSNSRQTPKEANIFTTNYDLFIEKAVDNVLNDGSYRFVFNDGAKGYFNSYLDSANFNKMVAYKGLNNSYIDELPSITLIKPHGSVNWKETNGQVLIGNDVVDKPMVVPPTGHEGEDTFLNNHFYDMLRVFQLELDKPESVLFVLGFSFQDDHIARMVKRALTNKRLLIECFCWSNSDKESILKNLYFNGSHPSNLKFVTPEQLGQEHIVLNDLKNILIGIL